MIPRIRRTPLRVLFRAVAVAVVVLMAVAGLPSASVVHAQGQQVTATRYATGESPPARPTGLQASAEPDSVSLTWTASTNQSVTHYAVLRHDRDDDSVGVFHVIDSNAGSATSYTDRSVSPEGSYLYRVKAVSPTGVSRWSSYARADIPADPAGLAPSGLSARVVSGDGGGQAEAIIPKVTAVDSEPRVAEEQSGALWTGTLTVAEVTTGLSYGCGNNIPGKECSSLLAPDDFTYNGTTYQITGLTAGTDFLGIGFLNNLGPDADSFVVNALGDTFSFQAADIVDEVSRLWYRDGNAWAADDMVSVSITVSGAEADELAETTVSADWGLIPSGLNAGDRFRLLFRTSTTRDATSTDIADYDAFVQTAASNGHADIRSHVAAFRVLGSTADVDARDNTTTTYTADDTGVPIYWLGGDKVADDYEDFYDGSWSSADGGTDEDGSAHTAPQVGTTDGTYTGSNADGTEAAISGTSRALGTSNVRVGRPLGSDSNASSSATGPFYGLSGVFVVGEDVEVPETWSLIPSGLVAGDRFRLIFLSSTSRQGSGTNIADYNGFVQTRAAIGHGDIWRSSSLFRVVGSTRAVDARDNTSTTYTADDRGVPIYWLGGNKVADDYADFYDGAWDDEANAKDESGSDRITSADADLPYTGSAHDGTEEFFEGISRALGGPIVRVGRPNDSAANAGPLSSGTNASANEFHPLYGLSAVFRVTRAEELVETTVPPDWSLIPSDLGAGDSFRLLFIGTTQRNASDSDIGVYNTFVQNLVTISGDADIKAHRSTFRMLGSTEAVDARDNTATTYTADDRGVPIYWLGGNKVADDYADFYDGDWDEEASGTRQNGVSVPIGTNWKIWTGSAHDGTEAMPIGTSRALGNSGGNWVMQGSPNGSDSAHGPIESDTANRSNSRGVYGLSGVFVVSTGPITGDFDLHDLNGDPRGVWGDDATIWVSNSPNGEIEGDKIFAYDRSTSLRDEDKDFNTLHAAGNNHPSSIWSDGVTMFVLDTNDAKVYAYNMSDKSRDEGKDITLPADNGSPRGIWGNDETIWVSDVSDDKVYAYKRVEDEYGTRDYARDFNTLNATGNTNARGIWSDGLDMFVADTATNAPKVYSYSMSDMVYRPARDFDLDGDNDDPTGIWGDDGTLWVVDVADDKLYAYSLPPTPEVSVAASPRRVAGGGLVTLTGMVTDPDADTLTYAWTSNNGGAFADASALSTTWTAPGAADADYTVTLTLTVTDVGGATRTATADVVVSAPITGDFDLHDDNGDPGGIWGNADTIWVSNSPLASDDGDKIFAYDRSTRLRDEGKDFNTLNAAGNNTPTRIWSDGETMFVLDSFDFRVYAYTMGDKARDDSKDIALAADHTTPRGIWGNGETIWVSDHAGKIFAYDRSTRLRDEGKDFNTLNAADNTAARGIWSDGTDMFVADSVVLFGRVFAYSMFDMAHRPARDFDLDGENSSPAGVWGDDGTLWVVDVADDKLYAYDPPSPPDVSVAAFPLHVVSVDSLTLTGTATEPEGHMLTYEWTSNGGGTFADSRALSTTWTAPVATVANQMVTLTLTVTDAEGETGTATVDVLVSPPAPIIDDDFDLHEDNAAPGGIWGNDKTIWVSDTSDDKIYAYSRSTGLRDEGKDFDTLTDAGTNPRRIWSDGVTMFVLDQFDGRVYAYTMDDKARDDSKDIALAAGNGNPQGIWGNDDTIWVSDDTGNKLFAYKRVNAPDTTENEYGTRDADSDFNTLNADNQFARGIWSDGIDMFVADAASADQMVFPYSMSDMAYGSARSFDLEEGNDHPAGIWSNGATLWVVDNGDDKLYAYVLPAADGVSDDATLSALSLGDVTLSPSFAADTLTYTASVDNDVTSITVTATANDDGATVAIVLADADDTADGHQVELAVGDTTISVTVTAEDETTTQTYTVTVTRAAESAETVPSNWGLIPSDLGAGGSFRLLFVTSGTRNATSPDIADYNTFVRSAAAAGHVGIRQYSSGFQVVGSTEDVDARDNTATTYTADDKGVPIYWLHGDDKVADDYEDFYDGSWATESVYSNEAGLGIPLNARDRTVLTGSMHDGTEAFGNSGSSAFGSTTTFTRLGKLNSAVVGYGPLWTNEDLQNNSVEVFYALSQVFLVGEPRATDAPAFSADSATREVDENSAAGTDVGDPVTAMDTDGDALTYILEGTDAASFNINASTGQIQTKAEVTYDYEADSVYSVTVKADDNYGAADTIAVTINITDVNEPPSAPAEPTVSAVSGSSDSLSVTWAAPDNSGKPDIESYDLQYRKGDTGGYANGPQDLAGLAATIDGLDANSLYQVRVRATNDEGDGVWSSAGSGTTNPQAEDLAETTVPVDWGLIPSGLGVGDRFRLIFISSGTRNGFSTDIADYNTFIQTAAAAGHDDIQSHSSTFRVVGSTADRDARDNTATRYTGDDTASIDDDSDLGVAIYWLDGTKVADQYRDFYDGDWDDEANAKNESGSNRSTSGAVNNPITGSDHDGTEKIADSTSRALGAGDVQHGRPNSTVSGWGPLSSIGVTAVTNSRPLYGLSGVFVVSTPPITGDFDPHDDNADPRGIWGNADTIWVSNSPNESNAGDKIFAYDRSTGVRDEGKDFNTLNAAGNNHPANIWSDGETMFVVDGFDDRVYAYNMSDKSRDEGKDITVAADNGSPRGIWGNDETIWVSDVVGNKLFAYKRAENEYGTRDADRDFNRLSAAPGASVQGIWSDGTDMFAADTAAGEPRVFAYSMSDMSNRSARSFDLDGENDDPAGIWSDGVTLWVVDTGDDKLYAYDLPTVDAVSDDATLSALSLSGVTLSTSFAADTLTYTASVGNSVTSTTVTATANDDGATVAIGPADSDTTDGHQVALGVGDTTISVTVTAEDGTTQTYTVTVTRAAELAVTVTADPSTVNGGGTVILSSTVTGSVGDVTYAWTSSGGGTFAPASAADTMWTAPAAATADQTVTLTLTVTDTVGDTAFSTDVTVRANQPPTVIVGSLPTEIGGGSSLALVGSASDPEGDKLTYEWTSDGGGSFDAADAPDTTWTAPAATDAPQTVILTLTVTDDGAGTLSAFYTVTVTVPALSQVDVTITASPMTVNGGGTVMLSSTVTGALDVVYLWSDGGANKFDHRTIANPKWTAPSAMSSDHQVRISLTVDVVGGGTASADVDITVLGNQAPEVSATAEPASVAGGGTVNLDGTATDPEGDDLTYAWTSGGGGSFHAAGALDTTWTAPAATDAAQTVMLTLTATDDGAGTLSASHTVTVIVEARDNAAPEFSSSAVFSVNENQTDSFQVTATDADDVDEVTYAITGGADQTQFSINATSGELTFFTAPDYENPTDADGLNTYLVTVTATGGTGARALTADQAITITVSDVNEPPSAPAAPTVWAAPNSSDRLLVEWVAPDNSGKPDIESYDLQYRKGTTGNYTDGPQDQTGTSAAISGLEADSAYQVQVRANNHEGDGAWSSPGSGTTLPVAPAVDNVVVSSDPGGDDTYAIGETIQVTVTFDQAVTVETSGGAPRIKLRVGGGDAVHQKWADYTSGSGNEALLFAYTVQEGDFDDNGIYIDADELELNGGTIRSSGGNDAILDYPDQGVQSGHNVDGVRPTPELAATSVDGSSIIIIFSESLSATTAPASAFTLSVGTGTAPTISSATASGDTVTLGLAGALTSDQVVTVTYIDPTAGNDAAAVQDAAGNDAASFTTGGEGVPAVANAVGTGCSVIDGCYLVAADWGLVPSDLGTGDSFRLLFIGTTQRTASASDIGVYNTFIQDLVAESGHADIKAHSSTFRMLGSTETVDARDNTSTTYTADDTGVPIYWLDGNKVADDYADFYDGDWDEEASGARQNGNSVTIDDNWRIWTGSAHDGTEAMDSATDTSRALGNSGGHWVMQGSPNRSGHGPIQSDTAARDTSRGVYGLSGVFRVEGFEELAVTVTADPTTVNGGGTVQLSSTVTGSVGDPSYAWTSSGGGMFSSVSSANPKWTAPAATTADQTVTLTLTVTDMMGRGTTSSTDVTVLENQPPTVTLASLITAVNGGASQQLNAIVTDPEGDTLTYLWTSDGGGTFDDADMLVTGWTAPDATGLVQMITLTLKVTDDGAGALSASDSAVITVRAQSQLAVTASAVPSTVNGGGTVQLSSTVTGAVGDVSYTWINSNIGTLSSASIDDPVWTAGDAGVSDKHVTLSLTVFDESGFASTTVRITVRGNQAPEVALGTTATELDGGEDVSLTASATDPEGDGLTYAWTSSAGGSFGDAGALETSWTAPPATRQDQPVTLTLTVTDDGAGRRSTTRTQSLTVRANEAPTGSVSAQPETVLGGKDVQLTASVTDPENDGLTYAWTSNGDGTFVNGSAANTMWTAPAASTAEVTVTLTLTVTDTLGDTDFSTDVTVLGNQPPVVSATADSASVAGGGTVNLDGTATDPEGDALTYEWTSDGGGSFDAVGALDTTWTAPDATDAAQTVMLTLTVTDDGAGTLSASHTVTVIVEARDNAAPIFTTSGNFSVNENQTGSFQVTAGDADDVDEVTYAITGGAD